MRMASYASPSPLHVERNRGNIVEIDGAGSGVAVSRTTDIFTDIIEGTGRLSAVAQKQFPLHNGISMCAFRIAGFVNMVDSSNIAMTEIHLGEEIR
jgi:hypothetical protein